MGVGLVVRSEDECGRDQDQSAVGRVTAEAPRQRQAMDPEKAAYDITSAAEREPSAGSISGPRGLPAADTRHNPSPLLYTKLRLSIQGSVPPVGFRTRLSPFLK